MKVLHVYKTYFPDTLGGVEQVINEIILSTSKLGVDAEVLTLSPEKCDSTITVSGHLVHRCHTNFELASTPFSWSAFKKFSALTEKADIIHYHFPWPFMDLLHIACQIKKPSLVTYHSDIIKQKYLLKLYEPLLKRFLTRVDCIIATSPNYFASSDVLQSFTDKTHVIPIGLDKENYRIPPESLITTWREKLPNKFFLFIGVLRYYKGLYTLIDAAKTLDYPIVIVGSGPTERELKQHVETLGIKNIHFLGKIDHQDKIALLTLCYTMVFPSNLRSEAFGVSLLEGAMFKKPMISNEIGTGTSFVNINDVTGLVIAPKNSSELREAMQYLWDNPEKANTMGERAEKRYQDLFTGEKMGQSYFTLYQDILIKNRSEK